MKVIVNVYLKNGVLDPQGKAVHHALGSLGFGSVEDVRIGKQILLEVQGTDVEAARKDIILMCEELLANTVIEDYTIEFA
ncbi:MAG: phosphoribosylformylglycinamidine synthase subunit PurS [Campylobacterales bacterium]|nr:phosphoribosylformylglycinamidine synthase subunit PurS [Campylobacterales bacterium]